MHRQVVAKEKEEREHALALAAQERERLNRRREELRKIQEEKRASFFEAIRLHLSTDLLGADSHFKDMLSHNVSQAVSSLGDRRLVVQVRDQARRFGQSGTFLVKDQLHACRYNWHSVNKVWEKSFSDLAFNFDVVRNEVWATAANGIDVIVADDAETELASYKIDLGVWTCRYDNIKLAKESSLEDQKETAK